MTSTDTAVREMIDEFQLRKLVHAYCRAVDQGDIAVLRDLYHHDATDAHGGFSTGSIDQFFEQLVAARPYIRTMQHNITTVNFAIRRRRGRRRDLHHRVPHPRRQGPRPRCRGRRALPRQVREARGRMEIDRTDDRHRLGPGDRPIHDGHEPLDHKRHSQRKASTKTDPSNQFFSLLAGPRPTTDRSSSSHSNS